MIIIIITAFKSKHFYRSILSKDGMEFEHQGLLYDLRTHMLFIVTSAFCIHLT